MRTIEQRSTGDNNVRRIFCFKLIKENKKLPAYQKRALCYIINIIEKEREGNVCACDK